MRATLTILLLLATVAGCAQLQFGEPEPVGPAVDPAGEYALEINEDGNWIPATLRVTGEPGDYGGEFTVASGPTFPVQGARARGNEITVEADSQGGPAVFYLSLDGGRVEGEMEIGPNRLPVRGVRGEG